MPDAPPPARRRNAAYGPAVREAARGLIEGTTLPTAAVAARVGASRSAVAHWSVRGGWARPDGAPRRWSAKAPRRAGWETERRRLDAERAVAEATAGRPIRSRRARGQPYRSDTVGEARRLYVATSLPAEAIAARLGISAWCVASWAGKRGWERPPGAPAAKVGLTPAQTGAGPRLRAAYARAGRLAERYAAALDGADPDDLAWAQDLLARAKARAGRRAWAGAAGAAGA